MVAGNGAGNDQLPGVHTADFNLVNMDLPDGVIRADVHPKAGHSRRDNERALYLHPPRAPAGRAGHRIKGEGRTA